jgi:hypothetical protein
MHLGHLPIGRVFEQDESFGSPKVILSKKVKYISKKKNVRSMDE